MGRFLLVIALLLDGCAAAPPPGPPTPLPDQPPCRLTTDPTSLCVLILGDSIAAGAPLSGDDRWWVGLQTRLAAAFPGRQVVVDSWAVSGSRVDVLESAARDQAALGSYDAAIVIEGVNDVGYVPLEEWRARFESAVVSMEQRGLLVVIGTPPPSFEDGDFRTRYDDVASTLRDVAARGRPLVDIAARWHAAGAALAKSYYVDLIHQGAAGQRRMADLASDALVGALRSP